MYKFVETSQITQNSKYFFNLNDELLIDNTFHNRTVSTLMFSQHYNINYQ